jgi:phosphoglycerol transferase MdoB-like AlkP superfamily enzyme
VKPYVNRYYGKLGLPVQIFRDIEHAYSEHLSEADAQVGEIIHKLRAYRLLDETVLVITSDHNLFLGLDKPRSAPFQFSSEVPMRRIPLIIRVPHEKGGYIDRISDHTDIAPTLLDIMDMRIPRYMEGASMWPLMKGRNAQTPRLNEKGKQYAFYSFSEGSGVGLDACQIIDDHVYVYNPTKKTGRVFDASLNELTDGNMIRKYERIVKEKLGKTLE